MKWGLSEPSNPSGYASETKIQRGFQKLPMPLDSTKQQFHANSFYSATVIMIIPEPQESVTLTSLAAFLTIMQLQKPDSL